MIFRSTEFEAQHAADYAVLIRLARAGGVSRKSNGGQGRHLIADTRRSNRFAQLSHNQSQQAKSQQGKRTWLGHRAAIVG